MNDPYAKSVAHYLSPDREDFVKRRWERPHYRRLLADGLKFILKHTGRRPLRVVDIGAGTGEGHDLMLSALDTFKYHPDLHYFALDRSRAMLDIAQARFDSPNPRAANVSLIQSDIVDFDLGLVRPDIVMSVGVPLSHLTVNELRSVLRNFFETVERRDSAVLIILDVLGRYSLEWLPRAWAQRRQYVMSFFVGDAPPLATRMTFYSQQDLKTSIHRALTKQLRTRLHSITFRDRSVFTGRHTATRLYNPVLPAIRTIINDIAAGSGLIGVSQLTIPVDEVVKQSAEAPERTRRELLRQCRDWNRTVEASRRSWGSSTSRSLLSKLQSLDQPSARIGLGIGHSLTSVLQFTPKR